MNKFVVLVVVVASVVAGASRLLADELPTMSDDWVLTWQTPCTIDTHPDEEGFCKLFTDEHGMNWLVFYDQPGHILFIRAKVGDEYYYMYQSIAGDPV